MLVNHQCYDEILTQRIRSIYQRPTSKSISRNSAIADKPRDAFRGQSTESTYRQTWYHSIC